MLGDLALMIDGESVSDNKTVKTTVDSAFPEYPDQNATKLQLVAWHMKFKSDLIASGFGSLLRNETPREALRLVDRPLLTVPADGVGKVTAEAENAKIVHQNEVNAAERFAILTEYKTRLASKLRNAMYNKALHRLEALEAAHPLNTCTEILL